MNKLNHLTPSGMTASDVKHSAAGVQLYSLCLMCHVSPLLSTPAAARQRWRQPFVVIREFASAPPLPQPPATHAHPAHTSIWPTEEPGEVRGLMLVFI